MQGVRARAGHRSGQSLIESCLAIVFVCLVFAGMFQVSQLFASKEVLNYAASRGARARTVGFNHWMVYKCGLVAAIPNSGHMVTPAFTNVDLTLRDRVASSSAGELWDWVLGDATPTSAQYALERVLIPEFLAAENDARAFRVLDYEDWDSVDMSTTVVGGPSGTVLRATARQDVPLRYPMHRSFYDADEVTLQGESYVENHYPLYLDDRGW